MSHYVLSEVVEEEDIGKRKDDEGGPLEEVASFVFGGDDVQDAENRACSRCDEVEGGQNVDVFVLMHVQGHVEREGGCHEDDGAYVVQDGVVERDDQDPGCDVAQHAKECDVKDCWMVLWFVRVQEHEAVLDDEREGDEDAEVCVALQCGGDCFYVGDVVQIEEDDQCEKLKH